MAHRLPSPRRSNDPLAIVLGVLLALLSQTALYLVPEGAWQPALAGLWTLALLHLTLAPLGGDDPIPAEAPALSLSPPCPPAPAPDTAGFEARVQALLAGGPAKPLGIALFLIEIEHQDRLRDLLGEGALAEARRIAAQALEDLLRGMDAKSRLGDGRFVALLDGMSEPLAAEVAGRLKTAIEAGLLVHEGRLMPLRVGIGVALASRRTTFEALLATAERALGRTRRGKSDGLHLLSQDREPP
ncbi:MAG: GGDEF domain-containing protein [Geminicoccaceae bacterium]|nr:GGDEF domain-containing protein [Geminicoccaceae bacterium]